MGNRQLHLHYSAVLLQQAGLTIVNQSKVYETAAWGKENQPAFYNQVLAVSTALNPVMLLTQLQKTEQQMGRKRIEKWGQRIIDIDILYYGQAQIELHNLQVPHPGIVTRRFTLVPLAEVAPNFVHPALQLNQRQLLAACTDPLTVAVAY